MFVGRIVLLTLSLLAAGISPAGAAPGAVDRTGPPPVDAAPPETRGRSVSLSAPGEVRLPLAASHVVFSWRGPDGAVLRYRPGPGARWRPVHEAHDLEDGSRHYSGVLVAGGTRSLAWGLRRGDEGVRDVKVTAIDAGAGSLAAPRAPAPATTAAPGGDPTIVTRAQWGADESLTRRDGDCVRRFYPVQQIFVHHTAGSNTDTDPAATMRAILWFHVVERGWCDIGYNFVIARDGTIYEGRWARRYAAWETHSSENRRGEVATGGHTLGRNEGSVGISMMGNFSEIEPPAPARSALTGLLAWEAHRHRLSPTATHTYVNPASGLTDELPVVAGHRDGGYTECPGNLLYARLGEIRGAAADVLQTKSSSSLTLVPQTPLVSSGEPATFTGSLSQGTQPLVGRTVSLFWRHPRRAWRESTTTTGADGSFRFDLLPTANVVARAVYGGDATTWGDVSPRATIQVRPLVSLHARGGSPTVAGVKRYPADTSHVPFYGSVRPAHPGGPVVLNVVDVTFGSERVLRKRLYLDAESRYGYRFRVPEGAAGRSYDVWVRFPGDADHAPGSSERLRLLFDPI